MEPPPALFERPRPGGLRTLTENVFEWTDEERQRAQAVLENDARTLQNTNPKNQNVTAGKCRMWRNWVADGKYRPHEIPADRVPSTVESHVKGECNHTLKRTGIPCRFNGARWVRIGVTSEEYRDYNEGVVVHTRECRNFPENPIPVSELSGEKRACTVCTEKPAPISRAALRRALRLR